MLQDKTLACRDCGVDFSFTVSEQEFYAEKGFENEPGRCPQCRSARKRRSNEGGFGRGPRQQRELFPATCAACGVKTQVPFQPTGDRPVYCRDCFSSRSSRY